MLGTVDQILLGNNGGTSVLGITLDPCVSAVVTTSNSGASLEKSFALTVELSNDGTPALNRDETSFSSILSISREIDDNQSVSNCRPDSVVVD